MTETLVAVSPPSRKSKREPVESDPLAVSPPAQPESGGLLARPPVDAGPAVLEDQELELAQLPRPVIHLPLSRSQQWLAELEQRLDRERPVAVLCHAGVRSWDFGCFLTERLGYERVWNLSGGIDAWSREVDPSVPRY